MRDSAGFTPLHWAVDRKHTARSVELPDDWNTDEEQINVVKFLLENGANAEAESADKITPLHLAAWHGYDAFARLLCDMNVNVDAQDKDGNTPLHLAASCNNILYANTVNSYNARVMMKRQVLLKSSLIKTDKLALDDDTKRIIFENCLPKEMRPLKHGTSVYGI